MTERHLGIGGRWYLKAVVTGRTKAYSLRELITSGLDELEEAYLAAATLERVRIAPLTDPRSQGKALQGRAFATLWRYRVGEYRPVCEIQDAALIVLVPLAAHRHQLEPLRRGVRV